MTEALDENTVDVVALEIEKAKKKQKADGVGAHELADANDRASFAAMAPKMLENLSKTKEKLEVLADALGVKPADDFEMGSKVNRTRTRVVWKDDNQVKETAKNTVRGLYAVLAAKEDAIKKLQAYELEGELPSMEDVQMMHDYLAASPELLTKHLRNVEEALKPQAYSHTELLGGDGKRLLIDARIAHASRGQRPDSLMETIKDSVAHLRDGGATKAVLSAMKAEVENNLNTEKESKQLS